VVKAELFPAHIRALGVGLPYAIAAAVFGGTTEFLALWSKRIGHESYFFAYVACCAAISLVVYATMRDTKRHSRIDRDAEAVDDVAVVDRYGA
jgi:MHS family alpha-ketoglutarate permease-like MFS transporter